MINIDIRVVDNATPVLNRFVAALTPAGKKRLSKHAALPVREKTREHIRGLAATRHKTAQALGAKPSNILARVAGGTRIVSTEDGFAAVAIPHPMFRRAFGDVTIRPKDAKALAIPVHASAYNKAPRTFADLFVWIKEDENGDRKAFLARNIVRGRGKQLRLMYLLRTGSITQAQDRSMLPTDEEWTTAARIGALRYIKTIIEARVARAAAREARKNAEP